MRKSLLVLFLAVSGCATVTLPPLASQAQPDPNVGESFYGAHIPKALRGIAEQSQATAPNAALTHELRSQMAALDGDDDKAFSELMAALLDVKDDAALLHVHILANQAWTQAQRPRALALLRKLAAEHPDAEVRAAATFYAAHQLSILGELEDRDRLIAQLPGRMPLSIVGTWDNEQGKGFDEDLGPEQRPGLDQRYQGRAHELSWRRDAPLDPRGRYDLTALMQPNRWAVAYGQGTFTADKDGTWALRITTSDPIKVWVDGKPVFGSVHLDDSVFDNIVVPVDVKAGAHNVLIKTAQREGTWLLAVRATPAQADEFVVPVPCRPGAKPLPGAVDGVCGAVSKFNDVRGLLEWRVRKSLGPERRDALMAQWAKLSVGGLWAVQAADQWLKGNPKGILARSAVIDALWFNQERGRAADALNALDAEVGDDLPFVRLRSIRFQLQQGLKLKARERLQKLLTAQPKLREGQSMLVDMFQSEGWTEDQLKLENANMERFSPTATDRFEHAKTLLRDGRYSDGKGQLEKLESEVPGHLETVRRLAELALDAGDPATAEKWTLWRLRVWPTDLTGWSTLAEIYRRMNQRIDADDALRHAQYLCPDWSQAYAARASLAYEDGERDQAITLWRNALALNPEDERLANRLDYLAPEAKAPWAEDVPDDAAIDAAVASREKLKAVPGADVAFLLDHEVTQLASDGSTQNVVTIVMHALNAAGRDRMTRQNVGGAGRLKMMHSYAVDPQGNRTDASSERSGSVFFRNLQVGSTVVLQYRLDEPGKGYLARHLTKSWSFQGLSDQRSKAEFILWTPLSTKLHETSVGPVKREEKKRGEQLRISWNLNEATPLVFEPAMPPVTELGANIRISTVPDWDTWLSFEKALLEGAFRTSPEVDAVAAKLAEGSSEPMEKAKRIHEFVMQEIRYQQDYETFIAGVKPHPAPMVLERKYGDCKDKAVLFITLAHKLGLDAHFALVRTRDTGPMDLDVPMQQFNHAIVYVPQQDGIAEGRFFDPTADALDLESLRSDDSGTKSLVFDPQTGVHTWRDIPYQSYDFNTETNELKLKMAKDGALDGTMVVSAVGRGGSALRRSARNLEQTAQVMQRGAQELLPGASTSELAVEQVKDLRSAAKLSVKVLSKTAARTEGGDLRLKIPADWNMRTTFGLTTRRHPLVLGSPQERVTKLSVELPEGFHVARVPADGEVKSPCLTFTRKVKVEGNTVTAEVRGRVLCERISANEYASYRDQGEQVSKMLDEELVLSPAPDKTPVKLKQKHAER
jgi:tetratricopeptide (TPR) repeat protein